MYMFLQVSASIFAYNVNCKSKRISKHSRLGENTFKNYNFGAVIFCHIVALILISFKAIVSEAHVHGHDSRFTGLDYLGISRKR